MNSSLGVEFTFYTVHARCKGGGTIAEYNGKALEILKYLCSRRSTNRQELSYRFGVSLRTTERDLLVLECSYPIYTTQGGGGIFMRLATADNVLVADWNAFNGYETRTITFEKGTMLMLFGNDNVNNPVYFFEFVNDVTIELV